MPDNVSDEQYLIALQAERADAETVGDADHIAELDAEIARAGGYPAPVEIAPPSEPVPDWPAVTITVDPIEPVPTT